MQIGEADSSALATQVSACETRPCSRSAELLARVVFYDGNCGLCHGFVRFLAVRDRRARLRFAALQGETFAAVKTEAPTKLDCIDSIVYLDEKQRLHIYSSAAIRAIAALGGGWRLALGAMLVPTPLRDWCYRMVARVRYRLFGRADACKIPLQQIRERFLP